MHHTEQIVNVNRAHFGGRPRGWLALSVALVAVLALVASACGGDDGSDSAPDSGAAASEATEPTDATVDEEPASEPDPEPAEPTAEPEPEPEPEPTAEPEPEPGLAEPESSSLVDAAAWQDCGDGLECAAFDVPLDYESPDGEQFTLNITRSPARDESARIGTIFVNPGGPGAGARSMVGQFGAGPLSDFFDVVGIDNRGTGQSTLLACNDNFAEDLSRESDGSDGWADETAAFFEDFEAMGQACADRYGTEVLASLTTENAARDMETARIALGDEPLNYLGVSYGTLLGSVYATMFPDNIRTLVLDSAISPSVVHGNVAREPDYLLQYERLDRSCALLPDCPMHDVGYIDGFEQLTAGLRSGEIEGATAGDAMIIWALVPADPAGLFSASAFMFNDALNGDTEFLSQVAAQAAESVIELSGGSNAAIVCADGDQWSSADSDELPGLIEGTVAPMLEGNQLYPCDLWPVQGDGNPEINYTGDAPILVVNNTGDALTPLRFAEDLVDELGPNATLLVNDSTGHGVFEASQCATRITMGYLIGLVVPEPGTTCAVEGTFGLIFDQSGLLEVDLSVPPVESALLPGDRVISIGGTPLSEMFAPPELFAGQPVIFEIERDGEVMTVEATPAYPANEMWRLDE